MYSIFIMVDLNKHCHFQGLVRNLEVGVISFSDPALQVITAGMYLTQKATMILLDLWK